MRQGVTHFLGIFKIYAQKVSGNELKIGRLYMHHMYGLVDNMWSRSMEMSIEADQNVNLRHWYKSTKLALIN
jgi:hypothetical protein